MKTITTQTTLGQHTRSISLNRSIRSLLLLPIICISACSSTSEKEYHPNGNLRYEVKRGIAYRTDKDGKTLNWSCPVNSEGEKNGTAVQYRKDGSREKEIPFVSGCTIGSAVYYGDDGQTIIKKTPYFFGNIVGIVEERIDGKLQQTAKYEDDILVAKKVNGRWVSDKQGLERLARKRKDDESWDNLYKKMAAEADEGRSRHEAKRREERRRSGADSWATALGSPQVQNALAGLSSAARTSNSNYGGGESFHLTNKVAPQRKTYVSPAPRHTTQPSSGSSSSNYRSKECVNGGPKYGGCSGNPCKCKIMIR